MVCPDQCLRDSVGLRQLSASTALGKINPMVTLKGYFDGGNKSDSRRYSIVSLAAVSGVPDQWEAFESDWRAMLCTHNVPYLHVTDLLAGQDAYEDRPIKMRLRLLSAAARLAAKHHVVAATPKTSARFGLFCCAISIHLKAFVDFAHANADAPKNADRAMLGYCLSEVIQWAQANAKADECQLFFDQGEPFYGHLQHMLQSKKAKVDATALLLVASTAEANMRRVPALQLADLYAWCVAHRHRPAKPRWQEIVLATHYRWIHIDSSNVQNINRQSLRTAASWGMPNRAPTK